MTTVAWKHGELACDSQMTDGNASMKAPGKLRITEDYAYAITGSYGEGLATVEDLIRGEQPKISKNTCIIIMDLETGEVYIYETPGVWIPTIDKMYAAGSGSDFAIGAMAAGASPEEAVKIAISWDVNSGFDVQTVRSAAAHRRLTKHHQE